MLEIERTDKDIPMKWVLIGITVLIVIIAFDPFTNVGIIGALASRFSDSYSLRWHRGLLGLLVVRRRQFQV